MGRLAENDPAFLLKENVRILLTSVHAVQKKVTGFSWRKLFPFNVYFRGVDYPAWARFLAEIREKIDEQRKICLDHPARTESREYREFFDAMEAYLRPLGDSADELREVALMFREQETLKAINARLDVYQERCDRYHELAPRLAEAWNAVVRRHGTEEPGNEAGPAEGAEPGK